MKIESLNKINTGGNTIVFELEVSDSPTKYIGITSESICGYKENILESEDYIWGVDNLEDLQKYIKDEKILKEIELYQQIYNIEFED